MATVTPPLFLTFLFFFFIISGCLLRIAKGQAPGQGAWCVAKPSTSDGELNNNIMYACSVVKDACKIIQAGGPCFEPQTLINHASVAMNLYYQQAGKNDWNCYFNSYGIISVTDPSYGECKYRFDK